MKEPHGQETTAGLRGPYAGNLERGWPGGRGTREGGPDPGAGMKEPRGRGDLRGARGFSQERPT